MVKIIKRLIQGWRVDLADTFLHSKLVWLMVLVIISFWSINIYHVYYEYENRIEKRILNYQFQILSQKGEELEDVFRAIYQHVRTISLIPSIRNVQGKNRRNELEDVVETGRLSEDIHQTIKQIYTNLSQNIQLSEIYYILDDFKPEAGEIPFFMYDEHIVRSQYFRFEDAEMGVDIPEEDESQEYAYYQKQLEYFKNTFPNGDFSQNLSSIPAVISPLLRTCDNSQYYSLVNGNIADSFGLLYSVPVYELKTNQFKGIISAVLRANVLEAVLVGVPFLVITEEDKIKANQQGWSMPDSASNLILRNQKYEITIFDRRNKYINSMGLDSIDKNSNTVLTHKLIFGGGTEWELTHFLTESARSKLTSGLLQSRNNEIGARIILLILLLAIFWKANLDQMRHHKEMVKLAMYDKVTALPNRRKLYSYLERALARSKRNQTKLGLMFVDVDEFSTINDTFGQRTGDLVLSAIAERLRHTIRLSDDITIVQGDDEPAIARLGGDDFALIFEDVKHAEDGIIVGERVLLNFYEPIDIQGHETQITVSGGMTIYPDDANHIEDLMSNAAFALKQAIENGVGQFRMFDDRMREKATRQTLLMHDLIAALKEQQFEVYYQPKQELKTEKIYSYEALIRWKHPKLGFVSPAEFIPLLEQSGQIVEVGKWVLSTACQQLKKWHKKGDTELSISVNVSPRQLVLSDMEKTLDNVLTETNINAEKVILEITESVVIDNLQEGRILLKKLKAKGIKLAIDDFGTGYSSLTYLQALPIDYLKLDKSMIDVLEQEKGRHVIESTIDLAFGLGLKVIAEGVEKESQKEILKELECDFIQGYLLSPPISVNELNLINFNNAKS